MQTLLEHRIRVMRGSRRGSRIVPRKAGVLDGAWLEPPGLIFGRGTRLLCAGDNQRYWEARQDQARSRAGPCRLRNRASGGAAKRSRDKWRPCRRLGENGRDRGFAIEPRAGVLLNRAPVAITRRRQFGCPMGSEPPIGHAMVPKKPGSTAGGGGHVLPMSHQTASDLARFRPVCHPSLS